MNKLKRVLVMLLVVPLLISQMGIPYVFAQTVSCSVITSTQYVPSWGKAYTAEDQYSRYIYQWMYWHNDQRLSWFKNNADSTYEPDAFFYNYDNLAYGDKPEGYWSSSLPSTSYVDTQFPYLSDELAVTIGFANASLLNSATVYFTVTRMTSGAGNSSWTKLSSQRGRRVPSSCYTTWCSFGCDAQSNVKTVDFTEFTSPGCIQYWWEWSISMTASC